MKPIQIFLIASLIFYFVFPHSSAYFNDASEMNHGYITNNRIENTFHYNFVSKLDTKAKISKATFDNKIHQFHLLAAERAKAFLFLMTPFLALILLLLFRKAYPYYIVHIVFALHSLSFFLFFDLAYIVIFRLMGFEILGDWLFLPLVLIYGVHLFFSVKLVYKNTNIKSLLKTILSLFLFLFVIVIYRQLVTILTVESL